MATVERSKNPTGASAMGRAESKSKGRSKVTASNPRGLRVEPLFCPIEVEDLFETVEWSKRVAAIKDETGKLLFEQADCEVPASWSQLATNVVVSKYFYGENGTPEREVSVRQLIHRVTRTIADWGIADGYFATAEDGERFYRELTWLCLHQCGAFNSPVWFNVGLFHEYGVTGSRCNWRFDTESQTVMQPENPYEYPQGSACFIQNVEDNMEDIMRLATSEAMLFKFGSGTGTDLSTIRSHREKLSGGGTPSGPLSFMRVYDSIAGVVKSGGKTRRAAKMQSLKVWHPDILEFIECKWREEQKAHALIREGYESNFNGEAYSSVCFQNANLSVRVTDEFMLAVERDQPWATHWVTDPNREGPTYQARELMQRMAECAWHCGDPGVQYDTTINRWHTCPTNGRINASNPCVTGDTLVATRDGLVRIDALVGTWPEVVGLDGNLHATTRVIPTGTKPVYRLRTRSGYELKLTADHRVWTVNRGDVPACELTRDDSVRLGRTHFGSRSLRVELAQALGMLLGGKANSIGTDGDSVGSVNARGFDVTSIARAIVTQTGRAVGLQNSSADLRSETYAATTAEVADPVAELVEMVSVAGDLVACHLSPMGLQLDRTSVAAMLRGLFTARGSLINIDSAIQYVLLESESETLLRQVQLLLLGFGIKSRVARNRQLASSVVVAESDGTSLEREVTARHSLRISRAALGRFQREIGFVAGSIGAESLAGLKSDFEAAANVAKMHDQIVSLEYLGEEPVYDLTEPVTDHFVADGMVVHNCSEYMFLDDTACNLASINLMKFCQEDGTFDVARFQTACRIFFVAQEILVDHASYPTDRIAENSHRFRPLGLGYSNLGSLIMTSGVSYDSDAARGLCGSITSILHGAANRTSVELARAVGPFDDYETNREPFLKVMAMHRDAVENIDDAGPAYLKDHARKLWDEVLQYGRLEGFRNAQATVLAPTGCLVGNSLVLTSRGLVRLTSLGNPRGKKWQELDVQVATDDGPKAATKFYINGVESVVTIETKRGYRIQGTPSHRIRVIDAQGDWVWRRFADMEKGDRVPLMLGGLVGEPNEVVLPPLGDAYWTSDHTTFVPRRMTADLAEFVGYYMGDGSWHAKGIRLCVCGKDLDVVNHLVDLGKRLFGLTAAVSEKEGYIEVAFHSVRLTLWWEACGFMKNPPTEEHRGKGYSPQIPDSILHSNDREVYAAFIRGLFEADGTVVNDYIYYSTVDEQFSRDVQTMVLALGYVMTRKIDEPAFGKLGTRPGHILRLLNVASTAEFVRDIGLLSARKRELAEGGNHPQASRHDHIPLTRDMVDSWAPENDNLRKTMLLSLSRSGDVSRRAASALLEREEQPELRKMLGYYYDEVSEVELGEEQCTYDISVPENVTYVANGFVSHNTISFLMDCDTTGIEPDIALVKYKQLAGGGMLKIVNKTVPMGLATLGYDQPQIERILDYIEKTDTIEGAPELNDDHLAVFDCAFKPQNGTRSIPWRAHVSMMAAAQPFLSGAISKTVNMPTETTAEEISEAYTWGWRLGLKALAIYRDGSKQSQPLSTKKEKEVEQESAKAVVPRPRRERLSDTRRSITHKFNVSGHEGYITVGLYDDGRPGEVFITMAKEGSTVGGLMDCFGTAISMSLQYGVPLEVLVNKFSYTRFEPMGHTTNPEIRIAKSVVDYIFRWLAMQFIAGYREAQLGLPVKSEGEEGSDDDGAGEVGPVVVVAPAAVAAPAAKPSVSNGATKANGAVSRLERAGVRAEGKRKGGDGRDQQFAKFQSDAPSCDNCGAITVRNGNCYLCHNCGNSMGCS